MNYAGVFGLTNVNLVWLIYRELLLQHPAMLPR